MSARYSLSQTMRGRVSAFARAELRASHAGEFNSVWIYRGILMANLFRQDKALDSFAQHHLATEKQHLFEFKQTIHEYRSSSRLLVWALLMSRLG